MKVKTKKIVQIGLHSVVLATSVAAYAVSGTVSPSDTPAAASITSASCDMVSQNSPFSFTASRNVGLAWNCSQTGVAVNSGNTKGKFSYGGSSNGGSVKQCSSSVSTTNGYAATPGSSTGDGCS